MENFSSSNEPISPDKLLKSKSFFQKTAVYVLVVFLGLVVGYILFLSAPSAFKAPVVVNIEKGASLRTVSLKLKNEHLIRSRVVFEIFVILYGGEKHIIPSDYLFENKSPVFKIARRISKGENRLAPIKITIPEGFSSIDIAQSFSAKLSNFNKDKFLIKAKSLEGYLFPDTYFFFMTDNEEIALKLMTDNYERKIKTIRAEIVSLGKTEKEIIIMASIIEREAKGEADRGFISGILWKRLAINMPLQVDAAPDTYKTRGLPSSPIASPGLSAIKAALYPDSSPYLYYIHDKDGNIYYAKNFEEHKANISKYLK